MHSFVHEWGRLLVIGGAESHDEHDDAILSRFVELAGEGARIIVIATASARADRREKEYLAVFERLGAGEVRPLRLETRDQANSDEAVATVQWATGAFFTSADQLRITTVIGGDRCIAPGVG
jgi:cyanophycinase